MSRIVPACLTFLACLAVLPAAGQPPAAEPLVDQVRSAIDAGVRFLRQAERNRGHWEHGAALTLTRGGRTALALLALLNCGVKPDHPLVRDGLAYLRDVQPQDTYIVGLQTMVFAAAGDPADLPRIRRNVAWLIDARVMRDGTFRGWGYSKTGVADNSNSQYALLGLYAGKQAGAVIDRSVWESVLRFYADTQEANGGWRYSNYRADRAPRLTMTIAGLCGLYIAREELDAGRQLRPDGIDPNCGKYPENAAVQKALSWLAADDSRPARFRLDDPFQNTFYNIYGIERAGRLSGQRFLAGHDWYREGCEFLVHRQHEEDGSWHINANGASDADAVISTSFALLFLSKGRTPALISKFAHGRDEGWNNKHHDARHLAEYASKELFKRLPLAWQVYDARGVDLSRRDTHLAEVGHLLQSPILYLNGHDSPVQTLTAVQRQLLKRYLEEGGFLFAEACCNSEAFRAGFRQMMAELFPEAKLEPLRPDHPIWSAHAPVPPGFAHLEGVELGCKTVVVFSPDALAGYWEANQYRPRTERVPETDRATLAFRLAGNVIAYATGLEPPQPRLTEIKVADDRPERQIARGFLKAAQVRHTGDWQPAPRALPNLMRHLRAEHKLDVDLQNEEMRLNEANLFLFKFLYLHGRKAFDATAEELDNLRANLKAGGVLFADACCGSKEFDAAFRAFAAKLFPDAKLEPIPVTDELYSAGLNGTPITSVRVRRERPDGKGAEAEYRDAPPALEGIRVGGRWAVIYSKYDVGCALENHQSSDCRSHDKASALRLGTAAVLYALKK